MVNAIRTALYLAGILALPVFAQPQYLSEMDRIRARAEWFTEQRAYPFDTLPHTHIIRETHTALARQRKAQGGQLTAYNWRAIGPDSTGGRMPCLDVHPGARQVWYAGSAGGGVWQSTNAGHTWRQLPTRDFPVLAVGAIAVNPHNPALILAGTGEANFAYNNYPGFGIMRSDDGGESWQRSGADWLNGSISDIEFHPLDSTLVFAACAGFGGTPGIYRSTNGGHTWELVLFGPTAMDIAIHPLGRIVYAVLSAPNGHPENGLYRSQDTGKTWTRLAAQFPVNIGRSKIACSRDVAAKLYVLAANPSGGMTGLFVSDNNGNSFRRLDNAPSALFGDSLYGQGWYDICIRVSPWDSNDITIGGIELFRSKDGGESWRRVNGLHVDQHAVRYIAADSLAVANDGGVYIAGGYSARARTNKLTTTQFYDISLASAERVYGGTQDNGNHLLHNGRWRPLLGGDVMQAIIHRSIPDMLIATGQYGLVYRSLDAGAKWSASFNGIDYSDAAAWVAPLMQSAIAGQEHVFFIATSKVYRSDDNAQSWKPVSEHLVSAGTPITALAQAPTDKLRLLAAANNGEVFYTWSGGAVWENVSGGLPNRRPTALAFNPEDKRVFYVCYSGYDIAHIWRSTNEGASWNPVNGNLPDVPVNCFLFDPVHPRTKWYAGTDLGLYYTQNAGREWHPLHTGMGIAPVTDLEYDAQSGELFAATYGMGIFREFINFLPVELSVFKAERQGPDVLIYWETAAEQNNAHFNVQRAVASGDFESIARVPARSGESGPRAYQWLDPAPPQAQELYYRLQQVDVDGTSSYGPVVSLGIPGGNTPENEVLRVLPNPISKETEIQYSIAKSGRVNLALYDTRGLLVRSFYREGHHNAGRFTIRWNGADADGRELPGGVYYVRLRTNGEQHSIKVIKE